MRNFLVIGICLTAFTGFCLANDENAEKPEKAFEPVHLEVGGLGYDLKKQEEYQINNDVFDFKKWYVEPFQKLEPAKEPTTLE